MRTLLSLLAALALLGFGRSNFMKRVRAVVVVARLVIAAAAAANGVSSSSLEVVRGSARTYSWKAPEVGFISMAEDRLTGDAIACFEGSDRGTKFFNRADE